MVHVLQLLPSSLTSNVAYHFAIVHMKSLCGKVHNIDTASTCKTLQCFPCGSEIYSDEEELTRTMEHFPLCKELLKAYRQKFRMPSKTPLSILYEYAARQNFLVSTLPCNQAVDKYICTSLRGHSHACRALCHPLCLGKTPEASASTMLVQDKPWRAFPSSWQDCFSCHHLVQFLQMGTSQRSMITSDHKRTLNSQCHPARVRVPCALAKRDHMRRSIASKRVE